MRTDGSDKFFGFENVREWHWFRLMRGLLTDGATHSLAALGKTDLWIHPMLEHAGDLTWVPQLLQFNSTMFILLGTLPGTGHKLPDTSPSRHPQAQTHCQPPRLRRTTTCTAGETSIIITANKSTTPAEHAKWTAEAGGEQGLAGVQEESGTANWTRSEYGL